MSIEEKEIVEIEKIRYICLTTENYNNIDYAFMNKLENNDEPTDEYNIFYTEDGELKVLDDEKIANHLIPIFQNKLKQIIESVTDVNE